MILGPFEKIAFLGPDPLVKIPEGAEYKDQWERVICPTI
jgi:hypothetical protein